MVRPGWDSGDFHSFFSRARATTETGTEDYPRSGRRNPGLVYAPDAARNRACLFLRVSVVQENAMEANVWADVHRGDSPVLPSSPVQSILCGAPRSEERRVGKECRS